MKDLIDFLQKAADKSSFAASLSNFYARKGYLTEKQIAAAEKMKAKWEAPRKADANVAGNGLVALQSAFANAKASGLKRPKLRISDVAFSLAPDHGRNAGHIYVKLTGAMGAEYGEYQGKISPEGDFFKVRNAYSLIEDVVKGFGSDPLAAAIVHGKESGECACCGRELTDPSSIVKGIGPVCEKRWFPDGSIDKAASAA